jgi:hypothetical protein
MTKPKTYAEIVDDIVDYYKTNPRGLKKNGGCTYAGCAVGYACGFQVDDWDDHGDFWDVMDNVEEDSIWEKFLPQYCKTNTDFWRDVQVLHDSCFNWEQNDLGGQDLSEVGKERVYSLKKDYKERY